MVVKGSVSLGPDELVVRLFRFEVTTKNERDIRSVLVVKKSAHFPESSVSPVHLVWIENCLDASEDIQTRQSK